MTKAPKKRVTHLTKQDEVSLSAAVVTKLRPMAAVSIPVVAIASMLGAFVGAWNWFGGPWPVSDRTLTQVIGKVEGKVNDLRLSMLDIQQRTLFLQKTQLQSNLAGIESQLREHPDDQFLVQRKNEVSNILEFVNREAASVQERQQRLRFHDAEPKG